MTGIQNGAQEIVALYETILARKTADPTDSYSAPLLADLPAGPALVLHVALAPVPLVAGPTCKSLPASLLAKVFLTADPFFLLRFDPEGFGLFKTVAAGSFCLC